MRAQHRVPHPLAKRGVGDIDAIRHKKAVGG